MNKSIEKELHVSIDNLLQNAINGYKAEFERWKIMQTNKLTHYYISNEGNFTVHGNIECINREIKEIEKKLEDYSERISVLKKEKNKIEKEKKENE